LSLPKWLKEIEDKIPENAYIIVAGNKLDLEAKRQVTHSEAKKFRDDCKLQYIETSAKQGTNVKKLFDTITSSLYENQNFATAKDKTIVLDHPIKQDSVDKKSKCCSKGG